MTAAARTMAGALASIAALSLAGISHAAEQPEGSDRPTDETISEWVSDALADDPRIDATGVDVSTEDGIVSLRGSVPTLAGKRFGVLSAQRVYGVLGVVDQVDVEAEARPDVDIARGVEQRLRGSRALADESIAVESRDATVVLRGRVSTWSQQAEAELLASEVRGVRAVEVELVSEGTEGRSDEQIQRDVEATLQRDAYLVGQPIEIAVRDGIVVLSGVVASPYEATRAVNLAGWVTHVRGVRNLIEVAWRGDRARRGAPPTPLDDSKLGMIVLNQLARDDRIDATGVSVEAIRGHVTLRGRVPSARQRSLAEADAEHVVGVAWVTNELEVRFEARPDDDVRADIERAYASDSALFESSIRVSVKNSVVTLVGEVPSGYHRASAAAIASRTRGVNTVVNELRALPVLLAASEPLVSEIERRLARSWQTRPIAADISVDAEDGVVTLRGTVPRFADRLAAERIAARTPGVRRVVNELVVADYPYPWNDPPERGEEPPNEWRLDFPDLPWVARAPRTVGAG